RSSGTGGHADRLSWPGPARRAGSCARHRRLSAPRSAAEVDSASVVPSQLNNSLRPPMLSPDDRLRNATAGCHRRELAAGLLAALATGGSLLGAVATTPTAAAAAAPAAAAALATAGRRARGVGDRSSA